LDLDPGTVVANRYRISRPLGRGGMGEVFAAENIRTGRPVAIKLLRQDSKTKNTAIARFRQEARAAGSINSDHVTQVLDVEEDAEYGVVLVFELLEGESLIDRLKRTGPIPFEELWPIIEQVWMGLADAHRAGIIHRDLKPSNVFLERRPDGTTRVKILDFGISKVPKEVGGETLTEMGQSLGTFSFMPPEQIGKAKTVDHRADIYACATLIYQSLTGQLPYSARNILVMVEMKSKTDARKLSEAASGPVDPRLEAFVMRGLARDPTQRFQNALDALAAWRELKPAGPSSGQPASGGAVSSSPSVSAGPATYGSAVNAVVRTPAPPAIVEKPLGIPKVHDVEMTTEETAATLAMPRSNLRKGPAAQQGAPPLAPRVTSAASQIQVTGGGTIPVIGQAMDPQAPLGPGGTQLVKVPGRTRAPETPPADSGSALQSHPAGYYIPPAVAASLARATPQSAQGSSQVAAPATPLPSAYEEGTSQPMSSSDGATQVYRPRQSDVSTAKSAKPPIAEDTASRQSAAMAPPEPKPRTFASLLLVVVGCLVLSFAVVAGVLMMLKR
jgi:serine/threonine-protein kinase